MGKSLSRSQPIYWISRGNIHGYVATQHSSGLSMWRLISGETESVISFPFVTDCLLRYVSYIVLDSTPQSCFSTVLTGSR